MKSIFTISIYNLKFKGISQTRETPVALAGVKEMTKRLLMLLWNGGARIGLSFISHWRGALCCHANIPCWWANWLAVSLFAPHNLIYIPKLSTQNFRSLEICKFVTLPLGIYTEPPAEQKFSNKNRIRISENPFRSYACTWIEEKKTVILEIGSLQICDSASRDIYGATSRTKFFEQK